jgi:serine phosphatase RsbU (regulator of sigma subunit)
MGTSLRLASHFQPASECGGDWWGFYSLPGGRDLVVVGDVTGHGVAAAIMTGVAKAACELLCHTWGAELTSAELLRLMNVAFCRSAQQVIITRCCAAMFEPGSGIVSLASAGHPFPYLIREGYVQPLAVRGQPFGASLDATYEPLELPFHARDMFVWFTDGVIERENEAGELFSERRLRAACQRGHAGGAESIRDSVVQALNDFAGGRSAGDDITLVAGAVP